MCQTYSCGCKNIYKWEFFCDILLIELIYLAAVTYGSIQRHAVPSASNNGEEPQYTKKNIRFFFQVMITVQRMLKGMVRILSLTTTANASSNRLGAGKQATTSSYRSWRWGAPFNQTLHLLEGNSNREGSKNAKGCVIWLCPVLCLQKKRRDYECVAALSSVKFLSR